MILRKLIFLNWANLFFIAFSFGQTNADRLKSIKEKFQKINNDKTLKKITLENEEFLENMTDNGGKLIGYYKNTAIKKIYEWAGLSNGICISEFYFDNGQLIFVYKKINLFLYNDERSEFNQNKTQTAFEGRYYFSNNMLFKSAIKGDTSLVAQDKNFEKTLLERGDSIRHLLSKRGSAISVKKLIIGTWISTADKSYHVVFSDTLKTDFYNGKIVSTSVYRIDKNDRLYAADKENNHVFEYEILSESMTNLTLLCYPRGNLLLFKKNK